MKKAKKIQYGIEIVKPWSKAMYNHNDQVSEAVKVKVFEMWTDACSTESEEFASDSEWLDTASPEMLKIQKAVLCYGFGYGYSIADVARQVEEEIEVELNKYVDILKYSYIGKNKFINAVFDPELDGKIKDGVKISYK